MESCEVKATGRDARNPIETYIERDCWHRKKTIETQTTLTMLYDKHCEGIDREDGKLLKHGRDKSENYNERRWPLLDRDSS